MRTLSSDARINHLASRTCSVVHARDLRAAGIGRDAVRRRVDAGSMAILLPRTYGVGPQCQSPTFDMRCMAGVLMGGAGTAIDGEAAGVLRGVWDRAGTAIDVRMHRRVPRRDHVPFRFHASHGEREANCGVSVGPIAVVGFIDMCLRMARSLTKWQLAHVIDRGIYERQVTLDLIQRALDTRRRAPWITVLRDAVELIRSGSVGTRSGSEDEFLSGVIQAGAGEPIVNTRGALGVPRDEPDFYWPHAMLNVEIDGRQHDEPAQAADDHERDMVALSLGIRVIRVRARDVRRHQRRVTGLVMRALSGGVVAVDDRRYLRLR
jgi:hypothetical protein